MSGADNNTGSYIKTNKHPRKYLEVRYSVATGVLSLLLTCFAYYHPFIIFCSLFFSLAGCVVCLAGLIMRSGKGRYILSLIFNISAVIVLHLVIIQLGYRDNARAHTELRCNSNLRQIGLSLRQYAMDCEDLFPTPDGVDGLEVLREQDYLTDYGVYCCRNDNNIYCKEDGTLQKDNVSYIYFGGFIFHQNEKLKNKTIPVTFDIPGNHNDCTNILFLNGDVELCRINPKSCKEIIEYLHEKYKYPPELLQKLKQKAAKADREYGFPKVNI